ncbi:hypothetical protein QAD02_007984 [Eretmocerus hayati]|uniref:Uncharacterized protein n=1 Tax=Eretmocerus hayati TaxID=131215 RepID=A0ACC2N5H5_9HYME|nr:hypothetical protein QAD02_007984 [Eretmocerus hayati]
MRTHPRTSSPNTGGIHRGNKAGLLNVNADALSRNPPGATGCDIVTRARRRKEEEIARGVAKAAEKLTVCKEPPPESNPADAIPRNEEPAPETPPPISESTPGDQQTDCANDVSVVHDRVAGSGPEDIVEGELEPAVPANNSSDAISLKGPSSIVQTKEAIQYREGNVMCFVTHAWQHCDNGAAALLEAVRINVDNNLEIREIKLTDIGNKKHYYCLCVRDSEQVSLGSMLRNIYDTLSVLEEILIQKEQK